MQPNNNRIEDSKLKPQSIFQKLTLLLWKNWILRKRHWVLAVLEIFIPLAFMTLIVSLRTLSDSKFLFVEITENTYFKEVNETQLRKIFCHRALGFLGPPSHTGYRICVLSNTNGFPGDKKLFFGPPNDFTMKMIDILSQDVLFPKDARVLVNTSEEINNLVDSSYYETNDSKVAFYVGIFFNLDDPSADSIPHNLNYDLRLQKYWSTKYVYPLEQINGPGNLSVSIKAGSYTGDGFVLLQTFIDRAYMSLLSNSADRLNNFSLSTQMYPYPPYTSDLGFSQLYGFFIQTFIVFSLILLSPTLIKSIVYEKQTGVKELVKLMGMESWLLWFGWFVYSFFPLLIVTILISIILTSSFGSIPPVFAYSDPTLLWFILLLYAMSAVFFCFAISCFFSKPTLATTIGILAWILSYSLPVSFMDQKYPEMGLTPKLFSCILPNMALTWAFKVIGMFEGRALGIRWDNLWDTGNPRDQLTPGMIIIMLIFDCFFFLLITWYVDEIRPGTYGVPERWYFPFTKTYWRSNTSWKDDKEHLLSGEDFTTRIPDQFFEKDPENMKPGIRAKGLTKKFKTLHKKVKVAVDHVDLTCYEGHCTVLLGHNGAGKTTLMSVLTGVYPPSGGYAEMSGWNIKTHLKEARSQVGLCQQHNTLFTDLSVKQHLIFFAWLKGLSRSEANVESDNLLKRLELYEKKNQFGDQLSGGMKRKLCLAIALIGGSKVVILDEPSSGLDPESRRWVWDIVQQERNTRTVLVTTHHMEEADVLGDRVAIMASGKIVCCGSSLFLKNTFGNGYILSVTVDRASDKAIEYILSSYVKGSTLRGKVNDTLEFKIPPQTNKFPALLDLLTKKKKALGIVHLGLTLTTMEQVFLKVGKMLEDNSSNELNVEQLESEVNLKPELNGNSNPNEINMQRQDSASVQQYREQKLQGKHLLLNRIYSLMMKKYIYTKRKWFLLVAQALIPVVVTLLCLFIDNAISPTDYVEPSIELSLKMFPESYSLVETNKHTKKFAQAYFNEFSPPHYVKESDHLTDDLMLASQDDINKYRENYITSAKFYDGDSSDQTTTLMMYQSIPHHAPGIGINLIDNALLEILFPGKNHSITTKNSPLPGNDASFLRKLKMAVGDDEDAVSYSASALIYSTTMPIALACLTSSYVVFPLIERTSKAKQIQVMTGTPRYLLWITSYVWDLTSYTATAVLIYICFMLFDYRGYFTVDGAPGALVLVLFLYGVSSIPMAYVFSMIYDNAASGFAVLALINIVAGMVISITTTLMTFANSETLTTVSSTIDNITSLVPAYAASQSFLSLIDTTTRNQFCDSIDASVKEFLCQSLEDYGIESPFLPCCPGICETSKNGCFEKVTYLAWPYPSMGGFIMYLCVDAVVYFLILTLIELGLGELIRISYYNVKYKFKKSKIVSVEKEVLDEDVRREQEEAYALMEKDDVSTSAIVVKDLTKIFTSIELVAVNKISFHFPKGECFGLLGVNGAGKTTTFRMLTADEVRTSGDARINNNYLSHGRHQFVEEIGYCPQFDPIIGELTGEEMLSLMAGLRGVKRSLRPKLIDRLVALVDLTEAYQRPCATYSGGNKRKLSTAMALVGQPPLVFLDEPTSGVDPASRRKVWEAVKDATSNGQSVILSSHSMDECEALCSKVVIMAKGSLRCAGTPQHLKAKFGQGYTLQVKIKSSIEGKTDNQYFKVVSSLKMTIMNGLLGSEMTDEHRGMLVFRVPSLHSWSDLFSLLENIKKDRQFKYFIEDYAAMDPSLEQVFLSFVRESKNMETKELSNIKTTKS